MERTHSGVNKKGEEEGGEKRNPYGLTTSPIPQLPCPVQWGKVEVEELGVKLNLEKLLGRKVFSFSVFLTAQMYFNCQ